MKPPARPTSPAPRPAQAGARQGAPSPRPAQPGARPSRAAPRPAPPVPHDRTKLYIIGAVVAVALAVVGYGMSRPTTPWIFDSPEAKKSYAH
jgi:hypothetical protein